MGLDIARIKMDGLHEKDYIERYDVVMDALEIIMETDKIKIGGYTDLSEKDTIYVAFKTNNEWRYSLPH